MTSRGSARASRSLFMSNQACGGKGHMASSPYTLRIALPSHRKFWKRWRSSTQPYVNTNGKYTLRMLGSLNTFSFMLSLRCGRYQTHESRGVIHVSVAVPCAGDTPSVLSTLRANLRRRHAKASRAYLKND